MVAQRTAPMRLLVPSHLIRDAGTLGTLRFLSNVARDGEARRRVIAMRRVFRRYRDHLAAIALVGVKPPEAVRNDTRGQ